MTLRERIQAIQTELSAIADAVSGIPQPGPGIGIPTPPASVLPWTRNPGAPVVAGVTCFDNRAEALRYASQGFTPSGIQAALDIPLAAALDRADKLLAAKTSDETEAIVKGTKYLDPDTAAFASLTGWVSGGGLGGSPYVTISPAASLSSLIQKPGTIIGGNVSQ